MLERFAGRYVLLRRLGQGGMGEVFLVRDLATGLECALKRLSSQGSAAHPDLLRHEFEALTRVRHPSIVSVYELGFAPDGSPYISMEYVPGLPADRALARGDWAALCFVVAQVAHGLEALHALGVVHGDLKPSNLLVIGPGGGCLPNGVRLLDFGLASLLDGQGQGHRGTPGFAAPEVVRGDSPGTTSDLYSLGATVFALITGRPAYDETEPSSQLKRQQAGPPSAIPLEEAGAPAALVQLVMRLMAPAAADRPRDAREVRLEIERVHPAARRPLAERLQTVRVVGRERELARLEHRVARAPAGARAILVLGEPGTGKSTLLAELATRATLGGRVAIRISGAAFEGTGAAARAILRRLATEARVEPTDPALGQTVATALQHGPGGPGERDLDALVAVAGDWAVTIERRAGPVLLLIDDAERLDPVSRAFLRRLALHTQAFPLLPIWARRAGPSLSDEDRMLIEAGQVEPLRLGALDRTGIQRMVEVRINGHAPEKLVEFLWSRAGGHPGLTVELLLAAAEGGALAERDEGLALDCDRLARIQVPGDFEASLLARLDSLPAAARAAAAALAAWGRPLEPTTLAALAPGSDPGVVEVLIEAGLARREGDGRLSLSPPALAARVLEGLPEGVARALHRAALEQPGLAHAERFRHLERAGEVEPALAEAEVAFAEHPDEELAATAASLAENTHPDPAPRHPAGRWHERLARRLMDRGRYDMATDPLERALALERDPASRAERWFLLSSALLRAGRPEDVARVVADALAEQPPDGARARLLANEIARLHAAGELSALQKLGEQALALAESSRDGEALGLVARTIASRALEQGRIEDAETLARRAEAAYGRTSGAQGVLRNAVLDALVARARHDLAEAERRLRAGLEIARSRGDRLPMHELLLNLGLVLGEAGKWRMARVACEEAARLALEDARAPGAASALASLAQIEGMIGLPLAARRHARAAVRLARGYQASMEPTAWRSLAQAGRIGGRLALAERAARKALARAPMHSEERDWSRIEFGRIVAARGRWEEAAELWEQALEPGREGSSIPFTMTLLMAGRAALRRGQPGRAAERLGAAEQRLSRHAAPYAQAHALALRAEIALTQGRIAEGVDAARQAMEAFAALPAPHDQAHAALDFARIAPPSGEIREPVGEWLELAAQTFDRLGDRRNRERTLSLTVEWLRRSGVPQAAGIRDRDLIERVSWLLHSLSDLRELTQRAMRMAIDQLGAESGVLLLADRESGQLVPMAEHGAVDATARRNALGYSRRIAQRVTESGDSLLIADAPSDPRASSESVVDMRLRSILCVPLFLGGRVVGAVYLDDSRRSDAFSDADRGMLEGFAHLMAVAIEKARGHEEVQRENQLLVGENLSLRQEMGSRFKAHNVIGASSQLKRVLAMVDLTARTSTTVLITGENGTGKELIARTLHHGGKRRLKPFVAVNCGAIPESLIESELFGILSNVATGVRARDGKFVQADGGTLFFDEIGEMPLKQQVTLLAAIANREITPVGGGKPVPVDVRIIAATNRDLRRLVQEGAFREDLYYRLNVIEIEVPPLRERKADIPLLARHFVQLFAEQQEREAPEMSPEFLAALMRSDWPGNVRELQNYVERVLAMTPARVLHPTPPPRDLEERGVTLRPLHGRRLLDAVGEIERRLVREALLRAGGNQSHAARELGLTEQSMRYRLRKYGLPSTRENRRSRRK